MWQRVPKPLRIFAYILLGIFGLLLLVIVAIQIPAVQTYITSYVTQNLEKQWGTRVDIGKVNISFFETALIENIYVEDQAGDTLLYANYLKADIGLFALFGQRLVLDEIALENAYINLYRHAGSTRFNYEFIADSFASHDTTAVEEDTTGGGFAFDLLQLRLENIRLNYVDDSSRMEARLHMPYFLTEFETLGLQQEHVRIDNISMRELDIYFHQPSVAISDSVKQAADTLASPLPNELDSAWLNPSGFRITLDNFSIEDTHIRYLALKEAGKGYEQIDFEDIELAGLNLQLNNFYLAGDTLRAELNTLNFLEQQSGFLLNSLTAAVKVERSMVTASLKEFITANSRLEDEIFLSNIDLEADDDMLAGLQARASIDEAVLSMRDAAYFTNALDTLPNLRATDLLLNLHVEVADNETSIEQLQLRAEDGFYLNARAFVQNIDTPDQLRFDVQLQELTTSMAYIESLALVEELPQGSRQAGNITLVAQVKGTASDANLAARINSGVGNLQTNIIYKAPTQNSFFVAGTIDANRFDLRPFAGDTSGLGHISFKSRLRARSRGEAIDVEKFSMLIQSMEFNDYTYEGLSLEGHFIDSVLEMASAYQDPFLAYDFFLKGNLKGNRPQLMAEGTLERLNLLHLNLMEDSIIISTRFNADLQGLDPDELTGLVEVRDTELIRGRESWTMDSLIVTSAIQQSGYREIAMETDFMSLSLGGNYLFAELPQAIDEFIHYYSSAYPIDESKQAPNQQLELNVLVRSEPVFIRPFVPELELNYPMGMQASLETARRSFALDVSAPGILYDSIHIRNLMINANTTTNNGIAYQFNIDRIMAGEDFDLPQFSLEGNWLQDSLHFDLGLAPPTDLTHLILGGAVTFVGDSTILELDQTDLAIYGQDYMLADNAVFKYAPDYLFIDNFTMQRDNQRLSIFTRDAHTAEPKLLTEIRNFDIGEFMALAGMEKYGLAATLHGDVTLTNVMNLSAIEAALSINNLVIDTIRAGDVVININKVSDDGRLNTNISLQGPGNNFRLSGYYNIEDSTNAISLDVEMNRLQLAPWEPFTSDFLTDLEGSLQGQMEIRGSAAHPLVQGFIRFGEQAAFRLAETGARYRLQDQRISMNTDEIRFNSLTLLDEQDQTLVVKGSIRHESFDNIQLNIDINARNFELVNKPRSLSGPFYGQLYVRTDMQIQGPLDDIQVNGNLRINENTNFALVLLDEERVVGNHEYINFVDRHAFLEQDTATAAVDSSYLEQTIDLDGLTLNMNIHVIPQARFTVVVDPATGDNLEISGEADLRFRMDALEGMNLQGTFTVNNGRYRLSFLEVIQKNFNLEQGSTVEFSGDPMNAELNMTAIYTTETSRMPLIQAQQEMLSLTELSEARQRRPVEVHLSLVGTLEEPAFSFNILAPESDNPGSAVEQQLREIRQEEAKLFRQVFGLIVMNRFLPTTPGMGGDESGGAGQAINARVDQSLSQFLTDQLNGLSEDYLGVSIEVDVSTRQNMMGQDAGFDDKDVGLQMGRSLFNDRVEVKVGGTAGVGSGGGGATMAGGGDGGAQFAGSFEVLYRINERGNLNLTVFQRNQRNLMTNEFIPQPGFSLSYAQSFDQLRGFFGREPSRYEMLKSDGAIQVDEE